jgi:hypothetical protein
MKGGKPNEPENKAGLRLKAFIDSRATRKEEKIPTPKKKVKSKSKTAGKNK